MKIIDVVYGEEEINELVLVELIKSNEIQRLKGVSQFGLPSRYYHVKGFSRYEHSIGVLILLRRLGASLEEQIAGLLHDVSHSAFSHVVDWVIGDPTKEDYQDNMLKEFIEKSNLPNILKSHGFDSETISDNHSFSLLEQPAPNLCADRIDYTLREYVHLNSKEKILIILSELDVLDEKIVFNSEEPARLFSEIYTNCQNNHWGGYQARVRYYILSKVLKKAIREKIISIEDLWKTDEEVISILNKSGKQYVSEAFSLLENELNIEKADSEEGIEIPKKFRYINPAVVLNGKIVPLSDLNVSYKVFLEKQKEESKKQVIVKFTKK